MSDVNDDDDIRLDKWLWAARFFKTRALAREAVEGGKVHYNGSRTKPGRHVHIGDSLVIVQGVERRHVEVVAINQQRRPAKEASLLYSETAESIKKRETNAEMRKIINMGITQPDQKPDKKQRRQLRQFKDNW